MRQFLMLFGWGVFSALGLAEESQILATYSGGEIRQSAAEAFAKFIGNKASPSDSAILESLALTLAWNQVAQQQGMAQEPERMDLWQQELARLSKRALRAERYDAVKVDPDAVTKELASGRFAGRPEKWRLRQIFKKYPAGADEAQRAAIIKTLQELKARVLAGASFEELARSESDSQTKFRDGLIGNVDPAEMDQRLKPVLEKLAEGEVSEVFRTTEGGMLFYLEKKVPAILRSDLEQRDLATKHLTREKFNGEWDAYLKGLESRIQILESGQSKAGDAVVLQAGKFSWTRDRVAVRLKRVFESENPWESISTEQLAREMRNLAMEELLIHEAQPFLANPSSKWAESLLWTKRQFWALQFLNSEGKKLFTVPSESEIKAVYAANTARYKKKPEYKLLAMGWEVSDATLREKTNLAQKVRQQVLNGEMAFAEAAKKFSELPSAPMGGELGWIPRPQVAAMGKHVLTVVSATNPGSYAELVRQENMLYWLKVEAFRPERPAKFEEVRESILQKLANAKLAEIQTKLEQDWLAKLKFQLK